MDGFEEALEGKGGANISVFPKDGLLGLSASTRDEIYPYLVQIPEPSQDDSINPCNDPLYEKTSILHQLSCFAYNFSTVIVANMGEVQNCSDIDGEDPDCPEDGRYQLLSLNIDS